MPQLPMMTSREVIAALRRAGFAESRGSGSYVKMTKGERTAIVPDHGGERGTVRSILKQAGLTADEFLALLRG